MREPAWLAIIVLAALMTTPILCHTVLTHSLAVRIRPARLLAARFACCMTRGVSRALYTTEVRSAVTRASCASGGIREA